MQKQQLFLASFVLYFSSFKFIIIKFNKFERISLYFNVTIFIVTIEDKDNWEEILVE